MVASHQQVLFSVSHPTIKNKTPIFIQQIVTFNVYT